MPAFAGILFSLFICALKAGKSPSMSPRYQTLYNRKVKVYRWLYEFTFGQCGECVSSGCACTDRICSHVESSARKRGVELERFAHPLRFIGPNGCSVPPHLRETCTIYLCQKAQGTPGFDKDRYDRLKVLCSTLDWKLMCLEDDVT